MTDKERLERNRKYALVDGETGFCLNVAGMAFTDAELSALSEKMEAAREGMIAIEAGAIKNPDEKRKVTHFTDRKHYVGGETFREVEAFAEAVRSGAVKGSTGKKIEYVIVNGIGGSALGPQLAQFALNGPYWNELSAEERKGYPRLYFLDNTDTAGFVDAMAVVALEKTLTVNISKSGGTQETQNNILALEGAFAAAGLSFAKHACAVTMEGSSLDKAAKEAGWLKIIPMAESIGGRTSETSVVGHLPAALCGIDFSAFIAGACRMDEWTRHPNFKKNPAYLLAAMWYIAGNGKGDRNMVIVPYSDRLVLMSKYLQQLVMESLGKERDLSGKVVRQGLTVFGNKGGTDAHAYIQQLNDGRDDFFITFIEVLRDAASITVGEEITMSDYLHGFKTGLANALMVGGRQVIDIQIRQTDAANLGALIALYERAVAVYAELIRVNAFHQPGVQAYKLAARDVIATLRKVEESLPGMVGFSGPIDDFVAKAGVPKEKTLDAEGILTKLAENAATRTVKGCRVTRAYSPSSGWCFAVEAAR